MDLVNSHSLQGHEERVWCIDWSPTEKLLASAGGDKKIKVWNTSTWECVCTLEGSHTKSVRKIAWSPQGNLIASASFDGTTCIWKKSISEENGQLDFVLVQQLQDHQNEVKSVAWSNGGDYPG